MHKDVNASVFKDFRFEIEFRGSGVTRGWEQTAPDDTRRKKFLWANFQEIVDEGGRTGKKGAR